MKEILLNEKSLDGQFENMEDFYQTLPVMSRNLKMLRDNQVILQKHSSLYQHKITKNISLFDLQNKKGNVDPTQRDKLNMWKRQIASLMRTPPFWDNDSESADSIQESAKRNTDVLSFSHDEYRDRILYVPCDEDIYTVRSAVSTEYLAETMFQKKYIDRIEYIRQRYQDGRIRTCYIDMETNSVEELEKQELEELIEGLERFEAASTWKDILSDRFFDYKSYQPPSAKYNVFGNGKFAGKNIDKFRCGQHSQVRCWGYWEEEKFYVLRIERDHRYSDHG